jgi:hypothetical protein
LVSIFTWENNEQQSSLFLFPLFYCAASVKDSSGLPWGCCIQPLAPKDEKKEKEKDEKNEKMLSVESVSRCNGCFAYINPLVQFKGKQWKCPICKSKTEFEENSRYSSIVTRSLLPELKEKYIELEVENHVEPNG